MARMTRTGAIGSSWACPGARTKPIARPEPSASPTTTTTTVAATGCDPRRGPLLARRPGAVRVVMLGYALWQQRYGGDREITGKSIRINGENLTVVGVMPPGFHFPPWNVHGQVCPCTFAMVTVPPFLKDVWPDLTPGLGVVLVSLLEPHAAMSRLSTMTVARLLVRLIGTVPS